MQMPHGDHLAACARAPRVELRRRGLPSDIRHRHCGASSVSRVVRDAEERTDGAVATTDPRRDDDMGFVCVLVRSFFGRELGCALLLVVCIMQRYLGG